VRRNSDLGIATSKSLPFRATTDGELTLISMGEQGYGVTLATEATSQIQFPSGMFLPLLDEPGPVLFSAVLSPNNRAPALRDFLDLAKKASRSPALG
jgi:hypothetical protein